MIYNVEGRAVIYNVEGRAVIYNVEGRDVIYNVEGRAVIYNVEGRAVIYNVEYGRCSSKANDDIFQYRDANFKGTINSNKMNFAHLVPSIVPSLFVAMCRSYSL